LSLTGDRPNSPGATDNGFAERSAFDCGLKDSRRYAAAESFQDHDRYEYIYPLREWGWDRGRCVEEIVKAGLPVPTKSACFFCPASKPHELATLTPITRICPVP